MQEEWKAELLAAEKARQAGNEGMARVCARRAAGAVARAYLLSRRAHPAPRNAYQALQCLASWNEAGEEVRQAAERLTMQVTRQHTLPVEADLIEDARMLCERLVEA